MTCQDSGGGHPHYHLRWSFLFFAIGLVFFASLPACYSGSIGDDCTGEFACPHGTRCLELADGKSVCTVSCIDGSCPSGECVDTEFGPACASVCTSSSDCSGKLGCRQVPGKSLNVCWGSDENLKEAGGGLAVDSVEVVRDSTDDGRVSPGEEVVVEIYGANLGADRIRSAEASVETSTGDVTLVEVMTPYHPRCASGFASSGDCTGRARSCMCTIQTTLEPGEVTTAPVLSFAFRLDADSAVDSIPFDVRFSSGGSSVTTDEFEIPVGSASSGFEVESADLRWDTDLNGRFEPGEQAVYDLFARNIGGGTVTVVDASVSPLTAGVRIVDPAPNGRHACSSAYAILSDCGHGDDRCSCRMEQEFAPGEETGSILRFGVESEESVSVSTIELETTFETDVSGSSSDRFTIDLGE
jgi:hypothetical protein